VPTARFPGARHIADFELLGGALAAHTLSAD
jgi:hypothetical protein